MRIDTTATLHYFCLVAELKSFTKAAKQLDLSPSALSQAIQQLESRLETRLLNRTTRSISLTEAGQQLYSRIVPTLEEINHTLEEVKQKQHKPSGTIKIMTSYIAWKVLIYPKLDLFTQMYPDISLDIQINDGLTDIITEGFDIGIRPIMTLHETMVAIALGEPISSCIVASPSYFVNRNKPKIPNDLYSLDCIGYRFTSSQQLYHWDFLKKDQTVKLELSHKIVVNDEKALVQLAMIGKGLAYVFEDEFIKQAVQSRELIRLLEDWQTNATQYYIYYPNRKFLPSKVRAFIDYFK